jgi:hypothetical protein
MNILEETARIAFPVGLGKSSMCLPTCPVIVESTKIKTHQPNHDKADMCEAAARGYQIMWESTGRKHYKDAMDAAFADAKDYRSCGFVRPLGATV